MIASRGYVLAGGGSRRFGADKARAQLHGKPLVLHAAEVVRDFCGDVTVVSAPERSYEDLGLRTIADDVAGLGPLSGLYAALTDAGTGYVVLAACDFVGAEPEWLTLLAERAKPGRGVAFRDEHRWHPVFAIYSTELLPEVRRRLAERELSMQALLDAYGEPLPVPSGFERARSIDTPEALASIAKMSDEATRQVRVMRPGAAAPVDDVVAVEEPLEIRLAFRRAGLRGQRSIAITMRTPGHDDELAVGFLVGEQILRSRDELASVHYCGDPEGGRENRNVIRVELAGGVEVDLGRLQRNFYTTSSCGVCGKSSLEALAMEGIAAVAADLRMEADVVAALPDLLREGQEVFDRTGGLHAAGLFTPAGDLVGLREDVGRHNAVDKLVGWQFLNGATPLDAHVLVLSGRASFELLQKALVSGIQVVVAVGAPSSLAIELAHQFGVTLCGFVRGGRFNCYSHPNRIAGLG